MKIYTVQKGSAGIDGFSAASASGLKWAAAGARARASGILEFRDLAIVSGKYMRGPLLKDTIPLSDGAGEVAAVGSQVKELAVGDRVVATFHQGHPPAALGSPLDGMLTEYAVFEPAGP